MNEIQGVCPQAAVLVAYAQTLDAEDALKDTFYKGVKRPINQKPRGDLKCRVLV